MVGGVEVQEQGDEKGSFLITGTKSGYVINEKNYTSDIALFRQVAAKYNAEFDGWYAAN
jgi:hypothetical protein